MRAPARAAAAALLLLAAACLAAGQDANTYTVVPPPPDASKLPATRPPMWDFRVYSDSKISFKTFGSGAIEMQVVHKVGRRGVNTMCRAANAIAAGPPRPAPGAAARGVTTLLCAAGQGPCAHPRARARAHWRPPPGRAAPGPPLLAPAARAAARGRGGVDRGAAARGARVVIMRKAPWK